MRKTLTYIAPLVGAAAVAAAVAVAPIAAAAPGPATAPSQNCTPSGSGSVCQSPGNVQLNDAPPAVQFYPYGGEAFLL
jgi:hypothetical protein